MSIETLSLPSPNERTIGLSCIDMKEHTNLLGHANSHAFSHYEHQVQEFVRQRADQQQIAFFYHFTLQVSFGSFLAYQPE